MSDHGDEEPAHGYLLDNSAREAEQRFDSLAALFNPSTFRHIEMLGITAGWRCWEVGVGGPSVPLWLSQRVGHAGFVLATDVDVRWAAAVAGANVEIRRHDVARDAPPEGGFDLVHERLVLIHVAQREQALARMVGALRSGGWLLIEDFDSNMQRYACPDAHSAAEQLANKVRQGFRALLAERGADLQLGRRFPRLLREAGLVDVGADGYMPVAAAGSLLMEQANVRQVREGLVAGGHVSAAEVDAHLRSLDAGQIDIATPPMISAWGRRP